MYSIAAPTRSGIKDLDEIVLTRKSTTRSLLNLRREDINNAYSKYLNRSGDGSLLKPIPVSKCESDALKDNYRSLDRGRSHRSIRDEILGLARFDVCPYCNVSTVVSIDHALPKSVYPEFSVLAQNLIPACLLCNQKKGDTCFQSRGINLMHPFYVNVPAQPILFVRVDVAARYVTWKFFLRQHASMTSAQFDPINSLFKLLDLSDRYYKASVGEVTDRTGDLEEGYRGSGANGVTRYLERAAQSSSRSRGENYWKTALLRGLGNDTSFCNGGFRKLIQ